MFKIKCPQKVSHLKEKIVPSYYLLTDIFKQKCTLRFLVPDFQMYKDLDLLNVILYSKQNIFGFLMKQAF